MSDGQQDVLVETMRGASKGWQDCHPVGARPAGACSGDEKEAGLSINEEGDDPQSCLRRWACRTKTVQANQHELSIKPETRRCARKGHLAERAAL